LIFGLSLLLVAPAASCSKAEQPRIIVEEFPIGTSDADQMSPDIDGNIIVWSDYRNGNYGYLWL
jgi:beta propeller repeat protein